MRLLFAFKSIKNRFHFFIKQWISRHCYDQTEMVCCRDVALQRLYTLEMTKQFDYRYGMVNQC